MKRIGTLMVLGALLSFSSVAAASQPTFEDCDSAFNYGQNTSLFYVSASTNRVGCDLQRAEVALARSLKKQKIPPQNTEEMKLCFYEGLYAGYLTGLQSAYDSCNDGLSLASVARAASSVFSAMLGGLDSVDDGDVFRVFAHTFYAPSSAANACEAFLRGEEGDGAGVNALVSAVCFNQ
jgi:hypothetical protein